MTVAWGLVLNIFFWGGLGIVALIAGLRYHRRWLADYREKDIKYRLLVENANDIVYSLTMGGVFTYVSPTWTKLLGHTVDEVENHPFQGFVHPDDLPLCLEALNNAVKTENRPVGVEYRVLHKDGSWRWHISNAAPIYDAEGTVVSYMGIARDITEGKQAEAKLRESERRMTSILENISLLSIMLDREGRITMCNDFFLDLTGWRRQEVLHESWFEVFLPADIRATIKESVFLNNIHAGTVPIHFENEIITKAGARRLIRWNNMLLRTKEGEVEGIACIGEDITDRYRAEEALRESKERYRLIAENTADSVTVQDLSLKFEYVSPSTTKMKGFSVEEVLAQTIEQVMTPESLQKVYRAFEEEMALEQSGTADPARSRVLVLEEYCKDGSTLWVENTLSFIRDEKQTPTGILSVSRDVTERKQADEALRESEFRFNQLAEQSRIIAWEVDARGLYTYVSHVAETVFGYTADELVGRKHFYDLHPEEGREMFKTAAFAAFERKETFENLINPVQAKDGHQVWLSTNGIPLLNANGTLRGYRGSDTDITERKQAEEALQKNKEAYKTLAENLPELIYRVHLHEKGRMEFFNDKVKELTGRTEKELRKGEICSIEPNIHPEDISRVVSTVKRAIEKGTAFEVSYRYIHKDGKTVHFYEHGQIIKDATGKPHYIDGIIQDITDRKRAEEALRKNEALLRTLIDTLPDLVWLKDPEGVYLTCNRRFEVFFGAKEAEIVGKTDYDFVDKDLADFFRRHDQAAMSAGKPTKNEEQVTFPSDGHQEILETIKTPIHGEAGTLIGVLGIGRDISERKRAEESLQKNEEKFRKAFHLIPESVVLSRLDDGVMVSVNEGFLNGVGYSREEAIGKSAEELRIWNDPNDRHRIIDMVRGHGLVENIETTFRTKNGDIRYALISATAIDIDDIPHLLNISRDITDRKKLENALRESERSLRSTIDGLSAHIAVLDESGTIILVNKAWRNFAEKNGIPAGKVSEGTNYLQVCDGADGNHAQEAALFAQGVRDVLAGKSERFSMEYPCNSPQKPRWFIGRVTPFPGEGTRRVVVAHENNTERKLFALEREELIKALQDKNDEMESMLYASSHDLRTPLVSIMGFNSLIQHAIKELSLLLDKERPAADICAEARPIITEKLPTASTYIGKSAEKMQGLVDGILKLSRLGRATHTSEMIDMNALVRRVLATLDFQKQQAHAAVSVGDLPPCWGDPRELEQAFTNIIDNAVKYRDPARPLTIAITGSLAGHCSRYDIVDNGIGMKPDHYDQIWGLFSRLDPNGPVPGEGIGLAMVKRIVQRNHGKIWVESEKGVGSKFYLSLSREGKESNYEKEKG